MDRTYDWSVGNSVGIRVFTGMSSGVNEMNQRDSRRTLGYIKMLTSWKFLNPGFVSSGEYARVRVDRVRGELGQNSASVSLPSLCMKVSERGKRYSIRDQTGPITSFRVTKELRDRKIQD